MDQAQYPSEEEIKSLNLLPLRAITNLQLTIIAVCDRGIINLRSEIIKEDCNLLLMLLKDALLKC